MLTLEKSLKVVRVNQKLTGKYSKVKQGDILTVKFNVNGNGGNSPTVDIYVNGLYSHSPYARSFNEMFYRGKEELCKGYGYVQARPKAELEEI